MPPPIVRPLSRAEVRAIDRRAIEEYGLPGVVLMENAGRGAAEIIRALIGGPPTPPVAIVCGAGNNGGDGYVIARHLQNAGVTVELLLAAEAESIAGDAAIHFQVAERMRVPAHSLTSPAGLAAGLERIRAAEWVVDALLGTGSRGDPRPPYDAIIAAINERPRAGVVAIDLPSGLDCDTGAAGRPTVRASDTITFVAPKLGFTRGDGPNLAGRLHVVEIGVPACLLPT